MEQNRATLLKAIESLPQYNLPKDIWDNIELDLNRDVRSIQTQNLPYELLANIEAELPITQLQNNKIPVDIWDNIVEALDENEMKTKPKSFSFLKNIRFVSSAAALLIFGLVGMLYFSGKNEQLLIQEKSTLLSDGSIIYNQDNATIQYPKNFKGSIRQVIQTSGKAFYDIAKDAQHPFIIKSKIASIKVIGTSFSTEVSKDSFEVIVTSGVVGVSSEKDTVTLFANDKAIFFADDRSPYFEKSNVLEETTISKNQIKGLLKLEEKNLNELFDELESKHGIPIIYNKTKIEHKKITGKFQEDDLKTLLTNICEASNLTLSEKNKTFIIK
jgi:transmembrane sensor